MEGNFLPLIAVTARSIATSGRRNMLIALFLLNLILGILSGCGHVVIEEDFRTGERKVVRVKDIDFYDFTKSVDFYHEMEIAGERPSGPDKTWAEFWRAFCRSLDQPSIKNRGAKIKYVMLERKRLNLPLYHP
jgi:hypothetical protein